MSKLQILYVARVSALGDWNDMINTRRQRMRILHGEVHRQSAYSADRLGGIYTLLISVVCGSVCPALIGSFLCPGIFHSRIKKGPRYYRSPRKGFEESKPDHQPKRGGGHFQTIPSFDEVFTMDSFLSHIFRHYQNIIKIRPLITVLLYLFSDLAGSRTSVGDHSTYPSRRVFPSMLSDCRMLSPR